MNTTQPMNNGHKSKEARYDVKPNMSEMLGFHNSYNVALTRERYLERYTPALSSKTLIYDQSRITPPLNRYGTRLIPYNDPTVIYRPAGMDGRNSTRQTGEPLFPQSPKVTFPQNVSFIRG